MTDIFAAATCVVLGLDIGLLIAVVVIERAKSRSFNAGYIRGTRAAMRVVRERMDDSEAEWRHA